MKMSDACDNLPDNRRLALVSKNGIYAFAMTGDGRVLSLYAVAILREFE